MKLFKRLTVLAFALAVVMPAMAQFKIGPRIGINVNSLHFSEELFDSSNRTGFTGGLQAEFTIPVINLGFDASVMYVRRGTDAKYDGETVNNDYIEIPINLKYKIGLPGIGKIVTPYIFTGPSFAFLTSKKEIENFVENQKCDIAWNFGFGVQLIEHLQVGASYGLGMTKAVNYIDSSHQSAGIEGKNRYWTVTAAWLF